MNDFEKARLIYDLQQSPENADAAIENIKNSLSPDIAARIDNIMHSFKQEDIFKYLFSSLPYVHLIHSLDETQYPDQSKEKFQVPDSIVILKNSNNEYYPILIDFKSVSGEKETLKNVQIQQTEILKVYSDTLQIPQIYAIYWEKLRMWTINSLDQFERKTSQFKLPIATAFVNDLSSLFGDITYSFPAGYTRKSVIDPSIDNNDQYTTHEKYGTVIENYITFDEINYTKIDISESAIIDSTTKMKEIKCEMEGNLLHLYEIAEHPIALKLSNLTLRLLAKFDADITANDIQSASQIIRKFFARLNSLNSHTIPLQNTKMSQELFEKAFYPGKLYDDYKQIHAL